MNEPVYLIAIFILFIITIIFIVNNNKLRSTIIQERIEVAAYQEIITNIKENPLNYLVFKLPNGEIANTIKVKTITKKENNKTVILKIEATTRKKENGIFKDIPLKLETRNI